MFGAILGDIIGSVYEWNNIKTTSFPLFSPFCHPTDDSVMTCATAQALMEWDGDDIEDFKKLMVQSMQNLGRSHSDGSYGYGGRFVKWLNSKNPQPYNSWGNGSAMRVSPVGFYGKTLEEVLTLAKASAEVTHNHPDGIAGAQATAAAVFMARHDSTKEEIKAYVENNFYPLNFTLDEIRPSYTFDVSCRGSVPQAIVAFLEGNDYEDVIRRAISIGGDSDTIACIAGGIAHAFYGLPRQLKNAGYSIVGGDEIIDIIRKFDRAYCL